MTPLPHCQTCRDTAVIDTRDGVDVCPVCMRLSEVMWQRRQRPLDHLITHAKRNPQAPQPHAARRA